MTKFLTKLEMAYRVENSSQNIFPSDMYTRNATAKLWWDGGEYSDPGLLRYAASCFINLKNVFFGSGLRLGSNFKECSQLFEGDPRQNYEFPGVLSIF
jgi:hypothetical protein